MGGILTPAPTSGSAAGRAGPRSEAPLGTCPASKSLWEATHPPIASLCRRRPLSHVFRPQISPETSPEGGAAPSPLLVTSAKLASGLSPSSAIRRGLKREG